MAKKEVTNIVLGLNEHGNAHLSCEYDGARYHVWLDAKTMQPTKSFGADKGVTLFKNPPLGPNNKHLKLGDPGHFRTRHLDIDGAIGRIVVPAMLAKVPELLPAAQKALADKLAAEDRDLAAGRRAHQIRENAPELYALLCEAASFVAGRPMWEARFRALKQKIEGETV